MRSSSIIKTLLCCVFAVVAQVGLAERAPPPLDANRVVNESYNFRRNAEPEMTEAEYALYDKISSMVKVQPDLALKLVEGLLSGKDQQSPAFEFVLGNIYFSANRQDLAEQHYRKSLERFPEFLRAWSNLGALYYAQGRWEEAAKCLTKIVEKGDRDARNLGLLAYCLKKMGRKTAAEMDFIQALGLDPVNADYMGGLVDIYFEDKKFAQAEALLTQLIRLQPTVRQNWLLYASVLTAQERPLEAIGILESARGLGLLGSDGLLVLGDLYEKNRFRREAMETFRELQRESVKLGAERLLGFAESLIAADQLQTADEAIAAIDSQLSPPQQIQLHLVRAELFSARGDHDHQREQLEAALALDPLNGPGLLALGRLYKSNSDYTRAEISLETAAQQPKFAYNCCIELADIALKTRRYQRALDLLQRAAKLDSVVNLQPYINQIKRVIDQNENANSKP